MASEAWKTTYRTYSVDELSSEIARLKESLSSAGGITSAGSGSKNYTRDLANLEGKLSAAVTILQEKQRAGRGPRAAGYWGVPNFSRIRG